MCSWLVFFFLSLMPASRIWCAVWLWPSWFLGPDIWNQLRPISDWQRPTWNSKVITKTTVRLKLHLFSHMLTLCKPFIPHECIAIIVCKCDVHISTLSHPFLQAVACRRRNMRHWPESCCLPPAAHLQKCWRLFWPYTSLMERHPWLQLNILMAYALHSDMRTLMQFESWKYPWPPLFN